MNNILKTTIIAGFALVLGSATLAAQEAAATPAKKTEPASTMNFDGALAAFTPKSEKFGASVSVGYEDIYVFRGKAKSHAGLQASVDLGYALTDAWGIYTGLFHNSPLTNSDYMSDPETQIGVGTTFAAAGFVFDFGFTYYWYTGLNDMGGFDSTKELKFGLAYDLSALLGDSLNGIKITPSAYVYYDFDRHSTEVEAAVTAVFPVSKWILDNDKFDIDASIYAGWAEQKNYGAYDAFSEDSDYFYMGFSLDFVWHVNEYCAMKGGLRWAANTDGGKNSWQQYGNSDNNIWYGVSCTIGF